MPKLSRYSRPQQLLMNLLEQPGLVQAVQALPPEVLAKLVQRIGLEDSGELVAMFTTEQLMEVFDQDLWKSDKPGDEEAFDDLRFALWLEVLLESGAGLAARKVAEMDEDLLILALSRQVIVIDIDDMALRMTGRQHSDDDEMLEKELESCLYQELEEYRVISRNHRTWEAIRAVLVELDGEHHELLSRLLARCCHISHDYIEDHGGLYEVLSSQEMLEADMAGAREERREQKGYVPPASANSFFAHARVESLDKLLESNEVDPITRAHFRSSVTFPQRRPPAVTTQEQSAAVSALLETLRDAAVIDDAKLLPMLGSDATPSTNPAEPSLTNAMRVLRELAELKYAERLDELAYLSNAVLAGCEYRARELRPIEAAQAALAVCNLGAERLLGA
ncbi:MAG: hypothetical protein JWN48_1879, partial [Myxococcaceae bacterium]|nr:hypothetical protein [Myxococcaceae bacterium]